MNSNGNGIDLSKLMEEKFGLISQSEACRRLRLDEDDFQRELDAKHLKVATEQGIDFIATESVAAWLKKYDEKFDRRTVDGRDIYKKLCELHYPPPFASEFARGNMYRTAEAEDAYKRGAEYQTTMKEFEDMLRPFLMLVVKMKKEDRLRELKQAIGAVSLSYPEIDNFAWEFVSSGFFRRFLDLPPELAAARQREHKASLGELPVEEHREEYIVTENSPVRFGGETYYEEDDLMLTDAEAAPLLKSGAVRKAVAV